jgi:hypothetical protein
MRRLFPNAGADEKPGIFFTWPYIKMFKKKSFYSVY